MFGRKKESSIMYGISPTRFFLLLGGFLLVILLIRFGILISGGKDERMSRFIGMSYPFDNQLAKSIDLTKELLAGNNVPGTGLIEEIVKPFTDKRKGVIVLFRYFFPKQYALISEFAQFPEDINSLLGLQSPQTYLIVLQNSAEKRPNGGFFGSFAVATFDRGRLTNLELHDSYHPEWNRPDTKIVGPVWLEQFMPERDIYFVGANKIGFTYHDGANIKTLYEKSYPGKRIRGVIFLRTDMLEQLMPEIREQLRLWQYLNATVNLREGEDRRGKKEAYEGSVKQFVSENQNTLLKALFQKLPSLIQGRYINIYIENISGGLHTWFRASGLTTRFENNHAYFRDSNIIFNKSDRFVTKTITLNDPLGVEITSWNNDIGKLPDLSPNNLYTFVISYTLAVPESYHAYIRKLNSIYNLVLGQREEHILGLDHERGTRGNVYLPPSREVISINGDMESDRTFTTPFSSNAAYELKMPPGSNNQTRTVRIQVLVND